jgi:hypothetical protein
MAEVITKSLRSLFLCLARTSEEFILFLKNIRFLKHKVYTARRPLLFERILINSFASIRAQTVGVSDDISQRTAPERGVERGGNLGHQLCVGQRLRRERIGGSAQYSSVRHPPHLCRPRR